MTLYFMWIAFELNILQYARRLPLSLLILISFLARIWHWYYQLLVHRIDNYVRNILHCLSLRNCFFFYVAFALILHVIRYNFGRIRMWVNSGRMMRIAPTPIRHLSEIQQCKYNNSNACFLPWFRSRWSYARESVTHALLCSTHTDVGTRRFIGFTPRQYSTKFV